MSSLWENKKKFNFSSTYWTTEVWKAVFFWKFGHFMWFLSVTWRKVAYNILLLTIWYLGTVMISSLSFLTLMNYILFFLAIKSCNFNWLLKSHLLALWFFSRIFVFYFIFVFSYLLFFLLDCGVNFFPCKS